MKIRYYRSKRAEPAKFSSSEIKLIYSITFSLGYLSINSVVTNDWTLWPNVWLWYSAAERHVALYISMPERDTLILISVSLRSWDSMDHNGFLWKTLKSVWWVGEHCQRASFIGRGLGVSLGNFGSAGCKSRGLWAKTLKAFCVLQLIHAPVQISETHYAPPLKNFSLDLHWSEQWSWKL